MNLWLIHQHASPPSRNGLLVRPYHLANALIRKGHAVTVVASSFDHRGRTELLAPGEAMCREVHDGVEFLWLRTPAYTGNTVNRVWNMVAFARRALATVPAIGLAAPDVVLGSSPPPFAALAAERLAARYGVPFILEVRDLWPQTLIDLGNFNPRHPFMLLLAGIERRLYRRADRIVSVPPNAAAYMAARGAAADRIDLIPNGVDLSRLPPPAPPPDDGVFTVAYAGAHGFANGLDTILDAAALLLRDGDARARGVRLRFIGDGAEKPRLQERARREGLVNVRFDDALPNARIHGALAEADAFVANVRASPLYDHGISSNKFFDYMAMARPSAVAISAFNNPFAESGSGLVVPADDGAGLARIIAELAAMPAEERWRMGLRGRRYVEEHHDYGGCLGARLEASLEAALAAGTLMRRSRPAPPPPGVWARRAPARGDVRPR